MYANIHRRGPFMPTPSFTPSLVKMVQRKCAYGGTAGVSGECDKCKKNKLLGENAAQVQTKLIINQPNDKYEQEADRSTNEEMRVPALNSGRGDRLPEPDLSISPIIQRMQRNWVTTDEEEWNRKGQIETGSIYGHDQGETDPTRHKNDKPEQISSPSEFTDEMVSMRRNGYPLNSETQTFFGRRFGRNFSNIRIHTSSQAAALSHQINAQAFTHGNHIFFATGRYAPQTLEGRHLLTHELTHTIQQKNTPTVQCRADTASSINSDSTGNENFQGQSLIGRNFRRKMLGRTNFSDADLTGAKFNWADLQGANFNRATLKNAKFKNAKLARATFRDADMEETNLRRADSFAADFGNARLFRSNLKHANLLAANFRGANMIGAKLRGADLTGATITQRDLLGAYENGAVGLPPTEDQAGAENVARANQQLLSTLTGAWRGKIDAFEGDIVFTLRGGVGDMMGTFRIRKVPQFFHLLVKPAPEGSRRHTLHWNDGFGGHGTGWIERPKEGSGLRGSLSTDRRDDLGSDISLVRAKGNRLE